MKQFLSRLIARGSGRCWRGLSLWRLDGCAHFERRAKEHHTSAYLLGKLGTVLFQPESNTFRRAFGRYISQSRVYLQHCSSGWASGRQQADAEYCQSTRRHRSHGRWRASRPHAARTGFRSQTWKGIWGGAVGIKTHEFTCKPDTRFERIPLGALWVKVPAAFTDLFCASNVPAPLKS